MAGKSATAGRITLTAATLVAVSGPPARANATTREFLVGEYREIHVFEAQLIISKGLS